MTTDKLKAMCKNSRLKGLNRLMPKSFEERLHPGGMHILSGAMIHGDVSCIRALTVFLRLKGSSSKEPFEASPLDFTFEDWDSVPDATEPKKPTKEGKCCFCGEMYERYGCNPSPVRDGTVERCCETCDRKIVTPARIVQALAQSQ